MKILSIAIPCYNSENYMEKCVESLLPGGEDVEILIVNDGSKDRTAEIADAYEKKYPGIVKAIHQENGGHGEAVNAGIRNASGLFFKVVDSDDWVDAEAYPKVLDTLKELAGGPETVDMFISNFIYDKVGVKRKKVMRYRSELPQGRVFTWDEVHRLRIGHYLLMHSLIYRTKLLKECGLELPKHTFYVDNIFANQPLPYVQSLCYLNLDMYHYFLGREDQSVNEKVLMKRIDQQIRVTKLVSGCTDLEKVREEYPGLANYLTRNISIMMAISSIHLLLIGTPEAWEKREMLWNYVKNHNTKLYRALRHRTISGFTYIPGKTGARLTLAGYKVAQKFYQFN